MSAPPSELGVWKVGKLLGEGAFSKVYAATVRPGMVNHPSTANLHSNEWVLKISPVPVKKGKAKPKGALADALLAARLLHWEYTVYSSFLSKHPHVPSRPFGRAGFGDQEGWRFLAMARMGKTLRQHVLESGGALDPGEALGLGIRVLESLRLLHAKGVLFRDVKPENFMFDTDGELCIIDFGAAVKFIMHDGKHLESGGAAGTPLFMSTHSHQGAPASRRDDLESLCYMVLWMMVRSLPPTLT
jgi:serine/threonine protein kinase